MSPYRTLDVSQYIAALGSSDHGLTPSRVIEMPGRGEEHPDYIFLAASGPATFSTSMEVALTTDRTLWDVNQYYRALGIDRPYRPSRKDLRRAYQQCRGWDSERLTYYITQLLDRVVRRRYDLCDLGKPMDDRYGWQEVAKLAAEWASMVNMEGGPKVTAQDYLPHLGVDIEPVVEKNESFTANGWPYAFYLWRSRNFDDDTLKALHEGLVRGCSHEGITLHLSLGYVGLTDEPWIIHRETSTPIIFLHEETTLTDDIIEDIVYSLTQPDNKENNTRRTA